MRKNLFLLSILFSTVANAQSVLPLAGFQNVLPLYNPAATGSNEGLALSLIQKAQWSTLPAAPKLYALVFHTPFNYGRFGAGATVSNESAGIQNVLTVNGLFAYKINVATGRLSFGAKLGLVQWNEALEKLVIKDESETLTGNKKTVPDVGAGLYYKDNSYSIGIAANYSPGIYFGTHGPSKLYYTLSGEMKQRISASFSIAPTLLVRYTDHFSPLVSLALPLEYNDFLWAGLSYRSRSTLSFMAGINLPRLLQNRYDKLTLFYYFDYAAQKTSTKLGNGHELMLSYNPGKNRSLETIKKKRATVSPLFFD